MTEREVATMDIERSGIPWPVFAVTVAAAFMVALDLPVVLAPADAA